jgi:hypothetical protein
MTGDVQRFGFTDKDADLLWLGLMVRPRVGIPFVPLKHLVFETLMTLTANAGRENHAAVMGEAKIFGALAGPLDLNHAPTGPTGLTDSRIAERDRRYAAAVNAVVQGCLKRGERVRVFDALTEAGCWTEFRHARTKFPKVRAVVLKLRRSGASARRIDS